MHHLASAGRALRAANPARASPRGRLHYRSNGTEEDVAWRRLARFFGLPETKGPRVAYKGVTRLRWAGEPLFLVPSGAELLHGLPGLAPEAPVDPQVFGDVEPPVLLPPNGVAVASRHRGDSCDVVCGERRMHCISADLPFINSCEALQRFHFCERCEESVGSDQPALDVSEASPTWKACLVNSDVVRYPPTCGSGHHATRRLCMCRPVGFHSARPAATRQV